jgi:hypothetical protein
MTDQYVRVRAAGTPATLSEAKWEKRAEELSLGALDSVRASAAKWTGTIATLLAIFGVVSLVKGPSDITKVSGSFASVGNETWVIIVLGVAVALAAAATFLSALAAYGLPTRMRYVGAEVRRKHREAAESSRKRLNWSWLLALGALIALALAVGVTWLKTPDDPATPSRTIVFTDGGVGACGKLQAATSPGTVSILEKGQKTATLIDVRDVTAIGTLASCPGE